MRHDEVIGALIKRSGVGSSSISKALGKSESWARVTSMKGRKPALATVADVADVCGVDVKLVDRETGEIVGVVDPPHKGKREG